MGSSLVAFKYFFFHFFFRFVGLFVFIFDLVHNWIHLFEFGMRLCNKYSTVNNFNKPTCDLCLGYFATVVVRFICLRFSLRFFGIVGGYKLRRMCLHCLRSPYDFFRRQTRTKPYRDLAGIVRQPQGYRTIIMLSLRPLI